MLSLRVLPFVLVLPVLACAGELARPSTGADSAAGSVIGDASRRGAADTTVDPPGIVRGLYVNRFAAQSTRRMRWMLGIADSTEINALVIDVKDEFGLNYRSEDPELRRNEGAMGKIANLKALVDTMAAHGVVSIARMVVFKDSVAARANPAHVIRKQDGTAWRDREGLTWVNPYDRTIWEYNIKVAEEMARMGFDEIQFDYIRFPEPYRSLPQQVFPEANGRTKAQALAEFLRTACPRVRALGARCTIDVFGLVTTVNGALEVGQHWETLTGVVDVLLPMTYPSHYPPGSFGVARPNAEPYKIQYAAISRANERDRAAGITTPEHVRPWLQAFTIGQPPYGAEHVAEQKRAVYDAGYDGWVLWHPGSKYEPFLAALEREEVSRKQSPPSSDATAQPPRARR